MNEPPDDRSAVAVAWGWASTVISICLGMAVPGLLGYWLDKRWGTRFLFLLIGVAVGVGLGMWQLVRVIGSLQAEQGGRKGRTKPSNNDVDS